MSKIGLPVPNGFTVTTEACLAFFKNKKALTSDMEAQVDAAMRTLEAGSKKRFGDQENPFLVSVRSGARASMPGMMDTILNLG